MCKIRYEQTHCTQSVLDGLKENGHRTNVSSLIVANTISYQWYNRCKLKIWIQAAKKMQNDSQDSHNKFSQNSMRLFAQG